MGAKTVADRGWTAKEMRTLEELRMQGLSASRIAAHLGRTLHSVKGRLQLLGIRCPRGAVTWLEVIARGLPDALAAQIMGVSPHTVRTRRSRLRAMGYDFPDLRHTRYERQRAEGA
jgi:DNA-binding CsgD family transcriptional regulator